MLHREGEKPLEISLSGVHGPLDEFALSPDGKALVYSVTSTDELRWVDLP